MNALITGASGFIGPAVAARLQQFGVDVGALVRKSSDTSRLKTLGVRLVEGDVLRPESLSAALHSVDLVVHLAGKTRARRAAELYDVNQQGTHNVAAACAQAAAPPRLIVVSSLAAAGPGTVGEPRSEQQSCEPVSNYGRSKLAGELAAREFCHQVPTTIVRPPLVFGPGDRDGFALVRSIACFGWQVVPRRGLPLSAIHVDDLANSIWLAANDGEAVTADSDCGEGVYHVAHQEPTSLEDLGRMIAKALEYRLRTLRVRPWVFAIAAACGELTVRMGNQPGLVNWDKYREATAGGWVADPQKAARQLGFSPAATLQEQYSETVAWYCASGWLSFLTKRRTTADFVA